MFVKVLHLTFFLFFKENLLVGWLVLEVIYMPESIIAVTLDSLTFQAYRSLHRSVSNEET